MISMHGKVWKSLVSLPAFRDILTSYLKLPWHKLHTSQVADFQIWDKALSDDELLKVIMQFVAKMIHIVDREFRVATHWWTLCENYLLRQYCGIFQWSKDYNGSIILYVWYWYNWGMIKTGLPKFGWLLGTQLITIIVIMWLPFNLILSQLKMWRLSSENGSGN